MKVCFFAHNSKTYKNGAALSLINIAEQMDRQGIKVTIIVPNPNIEYPIKSKNIKVIKVPSFSMRTILEDRSLLNKVKEFIKIIYNRFSIKKVLKVLTEENPDIIHINGIDSEVGAIAANKLGIPYVWHIRQLLEEDFGMRLHNEKQIIRLLNKSDVNIAISNIVKEKFDNKLKTKLSLIYNGIPLEKYKIKNKAPFFSKEIIKILLPGRIGQEKGQLDANKENNHLVGLGIENINLILVRNIQNTNYAKIIEEYIIKNNLNNYIKIIDYIDDLKELRQQCDIGLICSKQEAFGRVTIETMASHMLVIGSNTGGTTEIITDEHNGLLYEEGDFYSLANKIKYAIENKDKMNVIIQNGYSDAVNKYSISSVVDQIIKLYQPLIKVKQTEKL